MTSFLLCSVSTLLVVLIGTPAAYAFARFEMKAKDDLFLFILATRMAPPVCLVIPFYLIFAKVGLLDTFLGLTIAYMTFNLSFYVWVLRSFCRDLPVELEEAAELEGWSKLADLRRIIFPLLRNGIIATAVLCFIFAWNEFLFAFMLGGKALQTLPVAIPKLITTQGVRWGELAVIGMVALLPVLAVVVVPATPHRPRTDARGGEGIARPRPFQNTHSQSIMLSDRSREARRRIRIRSPSWRCIASGCGAESADGGNPRGRARTRIDRVDCHTYSFWRGCNHRLKGIARRRTIRWSRGGFNPCIRIARVRRQRAARRSRGARRMLRCPAS